jgi:hypothetical protein
MSHRQIWTDPPTPEKKGSWHNPQHVGWSIHGSVPSFSHKPINEAVDLSQTSIDDKLLGLLVSYHQHAIGTFNTYLWGSTHRSLTNTGGGYSLEGADFSHITPRPSQPMVIPFSTKGPVRSQIKQVLPTKPGFEFKGIYHHHVVFRSLDHLS